MGIRQRAQICETGVSRLPVAAKCILLGLALGRGSNPQFPEFEGENGLVTISYLCSDDCDFMALES